MSGDSLSLMAIRTLTVALRSAVGMMASPRQGSAFWITILTWLPLAGPAARLMNASLTSPGSRASPYHNRTDAVRVKPASRVGEIIARLRGLGVPTPLNGARDSVVELHLGHNRPCTTLICSSVLASRAPGMSRCMRAASGLRTDELPVGPEPRSVTRVVPVGLGEVGLDLGELGRAAVAEPTAGQRRLGFGLDSILEPGQHIAHSSPHAFLERDFSDFRDLR
jgi:hypothetical protein